MKLNYWILILFITPFLFEGCLSDIRTPLIKEQGVQKNSENKGRKILEEAWVSQGGPNLQNYETYYVKGHDSWKGFLGKIGKPWPNSELNLEFKFEIESFNSSITFLDGSREGEKAGIQSWHYYESNKGELPKAKKLNKRIRFGLSAYQYFFEMVDRLKEAPIVLYAGEAEFDGKDYDLVFVTWHKPEPHRKHDQYLLYINKETRLLDLALYTLRENYLKAPGGQLLYGSIEFKNYKSVEGILAPFHQTIYLNAPNANKTNIAHEFTLDSFKFDSFERSELLPLQGIKETGNSKLKG